MGYNTRGRKFGSEQKIQATRDIDPDFKGK